MINGFTYGALFLMGALHALEPGHGKSFIASYMVGEKLKVKGLLSMLGTLLVSHFLLLTLLSVIFMLVFQQIESQRVTEVIEWVAPLIIIGFGVYLFVRYRKHDPADADCNCGLHDHPHSSAEHQPLAPLAVPTGQPSSFALAPEPVKPARNPALVGLITGLVPCPSALAPVIFAASAGFSNVLLCIGLYVAGMILVLTAIIGTFFLFRNMLDKQLQGLNQRVNLHLVSAVMIMVVGLAYFGMNFLEHSHLEMFHTHEH